MNCLNFAQTKKQSRLINVMPLIPFTVGWSYPQNLWSISVRFRRMYQHSKKTLKIKNLHTTIHIKYRGTA